MASNTPLIAAMRVDGHSNGSLHWYDSDDEIPEADLRRASKSAKDLESVAVKLADAGMDSLVSFVEETWEDAATESDRKKWSKADLLAAYRNGVITGLQARLRNAIRRMEERASD